MKPGGSGSVWASDRGPVGSPGSGSDPAPWLPRPGAAADSRVPLQVVLHHVAIALLVDAVRQRLQHLDTEERYQLVLMAPLLSSDQTQSA